VKRDVALETIDGEECVRIPLGRNGKQGSCFMLRQSWEQYLSDHHSQALRLINGTVFNGANQSVAKILLEANGKRVDYRNANHRDLRMQNLFLVAGKSGPRIPPAPKVKRSIEVPVELCDSGGRRDWLEAVPYGFHQIDLTPANEEKPSKWRARMVRQGAVLRERAIASFEIYKMNENRRSLTPLWADNYNSRTDGPSASRKIRRFGRK